MRKAQLYGTKWQQARLKFLAANPFCAMCFAQGKRVLANTVDHIVPHRMDMKLFWSRSNWQSLCSHHHNSTKQRIEKTETVHGCNDDGSPRDPNHHWND